MSEATEDLCILYRAVSRRQGRSIDYAGCVTAQEALRLKQMGLAKIVDVQADEISHAAATMAAQAGFFCVLNVIDGREQYRRAGALP